MSTQIFYFSGTGNSIRIARELQKRLPSSEIVPIIASMKADRIFATAENVGIVFPIHGFSIPIVVEEFLARLDLTSTTYLFAVSSRMARQRVFGKVNRITRKRGKTLDAGFGIQMPENYISFFEAPLPDEIAKDEKNMLEKMDMMEPLLLNRGKFKEPPFPLWARIITGILFPIMTPILHGTRYMGLEKKFYADEKCTGCGVCENVCLSCKVQMTDGRPVWQQDRFCTFCFACIHYCPAKAIQFKNKKTASRGRYHHPDVSANDIAAQKIESR
jgi:ferredoxin